MFDAVEEEDAEEGVVVDNRGSVGAGGANGVGEAVQDITGVAVTIAGVVGCEVETNVDVAVGAI